jgi:hypothetical protein
VGAGGDVCAWVGAGAEGCAGAVVIRPEASCALSFRTIFFTSLLLPPAIAFSLRSASSANRSDLSPFDSPPLYFVIVIVNPVDLVDGSVIGVAPNGFLNFLA